MTCCHHSQPSCCSSQQVQPFQRQPVSAADRHRNTPARPSTSGGVGKYVALGAAAVIALVVISAVVAVLVVVAGLGFFAVIGVKSYVDIEREARRNDPRKRR